ncbi:hypothetical protein GOBAR_AA29978 [Gossypium barbadense]|uniref:CCHC-type domain-containing protein n=1 Tax=Gossypium barbadense TaxID=3634 RepID=A0A2P5WI02_GOSBA|nr:hypothetical protein GOBAR_AA29978 [Gossypium barbadense]
MFVEKEYYINLHVGSKFVHDPHVRYLGGEMVRLKEDLDTISYFELCKIVKEGSTIDMINYWVKHKEIGLYVGHEIDTTIFIDDESMLAVTCLQFGGDGNECGEGGEVAGSKGGEAVEGQSVGKRGEVGKGLGVEVDDVAISKCGESDGGGEKGVREVDGKTGRKEVDSEGLNDSVGRKEDGNAAEYFDYESILGSEDDDSTDGLKITINDILPRVEHRNCVRHVLPNWSSRKKAKIFEFAFWKVVKSTTEREWEQSKEDLYKFDEGVHLEQDPNDYLHRYYHKDTYLNAYEYALLPINGSPEWTKSGIELVLPPVEKTIPSRPKKNRSKAKNELKKVKPGQHNRAGLIMRCRKCGGEGHNKRSCIQPNTTGTQSSTSTRTRSPKNNNVTLSIQPNTTGSQVLIWYEYTN